jgi:long-chain acyl-CoA synthetase
MRRNTIVTDDVPRMSSAGMAIDGSNWFRPVPSLLDEAVARYGAQPAMYFFGRRWSYRALGELVERAACGLQRLGVVKGTRVGLCLPNTPYSVICYFAALKAGAIVVNFNPLYVEREILHQVRDSGTTIMFVPDLARIAGKVDAIAEQAKLQHIVVCPLHAVMPPLKALAFRLFRKKERAKLPQDGRHVLFDQLIATRQAFTPVAIAPETDIAVLQYTGGTTGVPKGAMLTHANLTANSAQVLLAHGNALREGEERVLGVLPLFHVFALTAVMNAGVPLGAEIILLPRFEIHELLQCIRRTRPTIFPAVPTIYAAINAAVEKKHVDISSIRFCISGGAPLPVEVAKRFEAITGGRLVEGYGLSEASPVVSFTPPGHERKAGSVGLPVPGTTIEIRDPNEPSRVLDRGQKGEICVRGPQVMAGYWNRLEETQAAFIDGALRTGDIGYLDEDGYLFLVDRIKDVIICSGYNVYPRVLEEALYQHPAVAEALVIGIPDAYRGQSPKAFVALRPGAVATETELLDFLSRYVSKIEMPKAIEIRPSLPKTAVGKLSKKDLLEEIFAKPGSGTQSGAQ